MNIILGIKAAINGLIVPIIIKELEMTSWEIGFQLAIYGVGNTLGSIILGYTADKIGRKRSIMIAIPLTILFSIINCFTVTFYSFLLLRFLGAVAFGGILAVAVIYLSECMPDDRRGAFNLMMEIFRAVGVFACTLLALISNGSW